MNIQNTIKRQDKKLKEQAKALKPLIQIGKNGLTESVVQQIIRLIKKRKLVKIKFLKSFLESNNKKEAAKKLAEMTNSEIVYQTGFVVALYKR